MGTTLVGSRTGRPLPSTLFLLVLVLAPVARAQDASTGAIRGTVADSSGARIASATLTLSHDHTGVTRSTATDSEGAYGLQLLPPGQYTLRASAPGMSPQARSELGVEVGGVLEINFALAVAGSRETVTVSSEPQLVETQPSAVSSVIDERAITELPLNGRRFTDLALLTPGVTQDPRGLTSSSNGDLSFGGVRGMHSSFLVDGADNNNAFFAQARGRYRAPYQFSNEVVQQFRVSSNTYGAELGRSGGAVINVVTKSGSNYWHGSAFYYLRDGRVNARHRFLDFKPADRQHQFGLTVGGPIRKNRAFIFAGFDQHLFHVPAVVRFSNGSATLVPQACSAAFPLDPCDFEASDQELVFGATEELSALAGDYRARLLGNAGFLKFDLTVTPRHFLTARLSTSRYYGTNNVFFDPGSPVTNHATSENGEERVSTESALLSLTSSLSFRTTSHLRVQFSRDLQESAANSTEARTRINDIIEGFGRSSILPRRTREHRLHLAETLSREGRRHSLKFGGDLSLTRIYNFFPSLFGGDYIFDWLRVNPFSFVPQVRGLELSPLRAYAHGVPQFYIQNFGSAESHPDTNEYSLFVQDTVRVTNSFAISLGLRYDLQRFNRAGLLSNPLWPDSGKLPRDTNNLAPRFGFAWSLGEQRPLVVRGGFGVFYTRIPSIYTSTIATDNGLTRGHLFLNNAIPSDHAVFPSYPEPLVACPLTAAECNAPEGLNGFISSDLSAFSSAFQTPVVQQASLGVEREVGRRFAVGVSYLYVHGQHLIRARDVNLPEPQPLSYPVFDQNDQFLGTYYDVYSFSGWQLTDTQDCISAPCLQDLQRPVPGVGAINVFESAASSVYHGMTISARRRMTSGLYFRVAYTWGRASDDGQDALVVGRPSNVQNSFAPQWERGRSVIDQRHRFVCSWIYEPRPFDRQHALLSRFFNDWRISGVVTAGSGRPVNARVTGDANRDGNSFNDRLPGAPRNGLEGPDYATTDMRLARRFFLGDRLKLEVLAEAFNVLNRTNYRVIVNDDGFLNTAGKFVPLPPPVGSLSFPAYFKSSAPQPANAYAPRQVQFALKLIF